MLADQVGMSADKLERIRDVLKGEIDQGKLPGTVVMVARKGKLAYADAVGLPGQGRRQGDGARFRVPHLLDDQAAGLGRRHDAGRGRQDPVDRSGVEIPAAFKGQRVSVARADAEFARLTYTNVAADREMTVQDLLRHTSGLAYGEITRRRRSRTPMPRPASICRACATTTPAT